MAYSEENRWQISLSKIGKHGNNKGDILCLIILELYLEYNK